MAPFLINSYTTPTPVTYVSPVANSYDTPVKQHHQMVQVSTNSYISPRATNTFVRGTGTIAASSGMVMASGTTAGSLSAFESEQFVYGASGTVQLAKFSGIFGAAVAGTTQIVGYGNNGEGYFFGYNGTAFGILCRSGGLPQVTSITVTAGSTLGGTLTITLNGVATAITVAANTGVAALVNLIMATLFNTAGTGSGWTLNQLGTTITFTAMSSNVRGGTYSYAAGLTGITLTVAQSLVGVAPTDLWIPQTTWGLDQGAGAQELPILTPTTGNIFMITIETFNYGVVTFYVVEPVTGRYLPVHIQSLRTVAAMTQESCPMRACVDNGATASSVSLQVGDMSASTLGDSCCTNFPYFSTYTAINPTVYTGYVLNCLSLKNNVMYNGTLNKSSVRVTSINISTYSNNGYCVFFPLIKNATYTNLPTAGFTWTQTDPDSVTSYAKLNTYTLTAGLPYTTIALPPSGTQSVDLLPLGIHLQPGEELNVGMGSTQPNTNATSVIFVGLSWVETR